MSLGLRWRTLRHFRPQQVMWRVYQRLLAKACELGSRPFDAVLSKGLPLEVLPPSIAVHPIPRDTDLLTRADEILVGRFSFLNRTADYAKGIDWGASGFDRLWRFNLHYFEFGLDLALAYHVTGDHKYAERFKATVSDWIVRSPLGRGDAWHPYPLSLRLINWLWAWYLFGDAIRDVQPAMARSMLLQTRYLTLHLERDIGGNHLIKNLKALVMMSAFAQDTRLLESALGLLERQVQLQVLADGGHFERSPMYHVQVLQDLAEVAWYLRATYERILPWLDAALVAMSGWLCELTLPDGEISLFGDSAHGIVPRPGAVLALVNATLGTEFSSEYGTSPLIAALTATTTLDSQTDRVSSLQSVKLLRESGFLVTRNQNHHLVLDCGPFAPDELPAHGHCDALSFELALGNERFIVDSGTFAYTGQRRSHFRGTVAHNTVSIPGQEQTEIWGDFRAGRRARVMEQRLEAAGVGFWASMAHDGYRPRIHQRELWFVPEVFWLIRDSLQGGMVEGAASRLHVHPDRIVESSSDGVLVIGSHDALRIITWGGEMTWEDGAYSERFGSESVCRVLVQALDPSGVAYTLLIPGGRDARLSLLDDELVVEVEGRGRYGVRSGEIVLQNTLTPIDSRI